MFAPWKVIARVCRFIGAEVQVTAHSLSSKLRRVGLDSLEHPVVGVVPRLPEDARRSRLPEPTRSRDSCSRLRGDGRHGASGASPDTRRRHGH